MMLLILLQDGQHIAWLAQAVFDTSAFGKSAQDVQNLTLLC